MDLNDEQRIANQKVARDAEIERVLSGALPQPSDDALTADDFTKMLNAPAEEEVRRRVDNVVQEAIYVDGKDGLTSRPDLVEQFCQANCEHCGTKRTGRIPEIYRDPIENAKAIVAKGDALPRESAALILEVLDAFDEGRL